MGLIGDYDRKQKRTQMSPSLVESSRWAVLDRLIKTQPIRLPKDPAYFVHIRESRAPSLLPVLADHQSVNIGSVS